jgi:transposase
MAHFKLASRAYQRLSTVARTSVEAQQVRRAQGLLWLHAGQTVAAVARRLGMTRRAVYYWIAQYHARRQVPVAERVRTGPRSGRPPNALRVAQKVIRQVWARDPRRYGFRALVWTVPMLRCQIERRTGQAVSLSTVRRALRRLRYCYKRPRLVLARRSPTWRQAKGGLNAG